MNQLIIFGSLPNLVAKQLTLELANQIFLLLDGSLHRTIQIYQAFIQVIMSVGVNPFLSRTATTLMRRRKT